LLSASYIEDFKERIGMFGADIYIYIYIHIYSHTHTHTKTHTILFNNESLVLNPEIHIRRLLDHNVFTAFKVASYIQENTHNFLYND
jgi:hypothetical protein